MNKILDRYLDVSFPEYLADVEHVSNSMLKKLDRSPAHLRSYLDDDEERKPSDALITGRAAHAMVLETDSFNRQYFVIPDDLKALTKPQIASIEKASQPNWLQNLMTNGRNCESEPTVESL